RRPPPQIATVLSSQAPDAEDGRDHHVRPAGATARTADLLRHEDHPTRRRLRVPSGLLRSEQKCPYEDGSLRPLLRSPSRIGLLPFLGRSRRFVIRKKMGWNRGREGPG